MITGKRKNGPIFFSMNLGLPIKLDQHLSRKNAISQKSLD